MRRTSSGHGEICSHDATRCSGHTEASRGRRNPQLMRDFIRNRFSGFNYQRTSRGKPIFYSPRPPQHFPS
ncbi:hypothetical protein E2C01_000558 [Portunus trituberculatus]|uniref:Uncharacterized protein n=1 Tax=Portunus trituberculatus TaxID=210409 RepID=A0A5B7CFI7_PORTR|nr:hypothetical protein [Portunus trituberculatus]